MNILNRLFLHRYNDAGYETKKKAQVLLVMCLIFLVYLIVAGTVIDFLIARSMELVALDALMFVIDVVTIILITRRKFVLASTIIVIALLVFLFFSVFLDRTIRRTLGIAEIGVFLVAVLLFVSLISQKKSQVIVIVLASCAVLSIYFFGSASAQGESVDEASALGAFILCNLIVLLAGFLAYLNVSIGRETIQLLEHESNANRTKAENLRELFFSAQRGLSIGERLATASESVLVAVKHIEERIEWVNGQIGTLADEIVSTKNVNRVVAESAHTVRAMLDITSASIGETSNSFGSIGETVDSLVARIKVKRTEIEALCATTRKGEEEMRRAVSALADVDRSILEINKITGGISQIADRSSLLAMNAAIEAAHAGQTGKGFSIVAQEMRTMAKETNANSAVIQSVLRDAIAGTESATAINSAMSATLSQITRETNDLVALMNDVFAGIETIADGSVRVRETVARLIKGSKDVNDSMNLVNAVILQSDMEVGKAFELSVQAKETIRLIVENFASISGEARVIDTIGQDNSRQLEVLRDEIETLISGQDNNT